MRVCAPWVIGLQVEAAVRDQVRDALLDEGIGLLRYVEGYDKQGAGAAKPSGKGKGGMG